MSLSRLPELAEYSNKAVLLSRVQFDIRGYILGLKEEQRRISSQERIERYEEALAIVEEDQSRLPLGYRYKDLHELVIKIANGSEGVNKDQAEIVAGAFSDYTRYFLSKFTEVEEEFDNKYFLQKP